MEITNLVNKKLVKPPNEISIIDGNHCNLEETKFSIVKTKNDSHESPDTFNFIISNEKNEEFKGRYSNTEIVINTQNDESVFYLKNIKTKNTIKREIFTNEKQDKAISIIIPKNKSTYKVEFTNLAKEEKEYLEIKSDAYSQSCDVINGVSNKKNEVNIVCEIVIIKDHDGNDDSNCKIKIAPGVDYIFMIGLASFFFCENIDHHKDNKNYDNIARLITPSNPTITNK